jgi:hypothetical protein
VNELGGITRIFKQDRLNQERKAMPKARVTIVLEFELDRNNYTYDHETGGKLSKDKIEALTGQQMLDMEKLYLKDGETDLSEILANVEIDTNDEDQVKWELVD